MTEFDDYLVTLGAPERDVLQRIREVVSAAVPDAEEGRSYGVPAFRYRGRPLLGFQVTKKHLSVMPFSPEVLVAAGSRLAGFDVTKGSVRFQVGAPLPDDVVRDLALGRRAEIDAALDR